MTIEVIVTPEICPRHMMTCINASEKTYWHHKSDIMTDRRGIQRVAIFATPGSLAKEETKKSIVQMCYQSDFVTNLAFRKVTYQQKPR